MRGLVHPLWLKLELCNTTGSVKFRTAIGLVAALTAANPDQGGNACRGVDVGARKLHNPSTAVPI